MENTRITGVLAGAVTLAAGLVASGAAHANFRAIYISAIAVCEAPLPIYDATLRKRPLGIVNEGTDAIFISCSMPGDFLATATAGRVELKFKSFTPATATVSCTLIAGQRFSGATHTYTGQTTITGNGQGLVGFSAIDKGSALGHYNFSCNLPPGIEFSSLYRREDADTDVL